jgi:ABC-type molybdate transport system substrate-binding protein
MIKGFILSVLLILFTLSAANAQSQAIDVAAAKKEGKVIVYGSVVPQAMEELHKGFEKKYDIKVEYWRGSSTAVAERPKRSGAPAGPLSTWWSPAGTL